MGAPQLITLYLSALNHHVAKAQGTQTTSPCTHKMRGIRFTPDSGREASPLEESAKCQFQIFAEKRFIAAFTEYCKIKIPESFLSGLSTGK